MLKGLISGIIVLILGVGVVTCTNDIPAGYAGIQYNRDGGVEDTVLGQGWNITSPFVKVIQYPISTESAYYSNRKDIGRKNDDTMTLGTKDGKVIRNVEYIINYHMDESHLKNVFNKFRGKDADDIAYNYMRQSTQRILNEVSSRYTMVDICGDKKQEFNNKALEALRSFFEPDGIIIEQAGLGELEPDDQTASAIQAIANAQYAQKEAEINKQVAEAQAATKIAEAKGTADAKRIEADGEAYYNQAITNSTSDAVVRLKMIDKWNGTLPQYELGGSSVMLNMK